MPKLVEQRAPAVREAAPLDAPPQTLEVDALYIRQTIPGFQRQPQFVNSLTDWTVFFTQLFLVLGKKQQRKVKAI
jgi:hypothetical protein